MSIPRNEIIYDRDFIKDVRRLPKELQSKLAELLEVIQKDPFNPQLHTKPLSAPLQGMFSFRITRDYRVGFKFHTVRAIQLLAAGRRDKIYKRLQKKYE